MDMSKMFGKVREMQAKLKEAQENLENITATGEAGGRNGQSRCQWQEKIDFY